MSIRFSEIPSIPAAELFERHELVLLDAFGVLNDTDGALPGAAEMIRALEQRGKPWFVVTNDASRLETTSSRRFHSFGLPIGPERILTSGALLQTYFREHELAGAGCVVLGTEDSRAYVERAGGRILPIETSTEPDVLLVCDDDGYPLLESLDASVTMLFRALDAGRQPHLVLPNPDLLYPKRGGGFGITAGSVALVLEAALALRVPAGPPRFVRLGKPHPPLFEEAFRRAGTRDAVMVGDQLETDIRGAVNAGIASALVSTGITRLAEDARLEGPIPTWRLGP